MTATVTATELKQKNNSVMRKSVIGQEGIIVTRYGRKYVMVFSWERNRRLQDAARTPVMGRFLAAQKAVHEITTKIPEDEIKEPVTESIKDSRSQRSTSNG